MYGLHLYIFYSNEKGNYFPYKCKQLKVIISFVSIGLEHWFSINTWAVYTYKYLIYYTMHILLELEEPSLKC